MHPYKHCCNHSVFLTQEVEFGWKWQSISIRNKCVVSSILWLHIINNQPVKPKTSNKKCLKWGKHLPYKIKTLLLSFFYNLHLFAHIILVPSNVSHFDAIAWQDLHSIFVPLSCDLVIRHLTLEQCLVCRPDCQISNVLQYLQFFFWIRDWKTHTQKNRSDRNHSMWQ